MDFQLPHNLKTIRKKWKLNQTEFAQLLNSERVPISNYEIGKHTPGIHFLLKLQDLTGIPAKALCYESLQKGAIPQRPLSFPTDPYLASDPGIAYLSREDLQKIQALARLSRELEQTLGEVLEIFTLKKN